MKGHFLYLGWSYFREARLKREGTIEVDFVLSHVEKIIALEVKSGLSERKNGLEFFKKKYPEAKVLLVGQGGIPFEEFS